MKRSALFIAACVAAALLPAVHAQAQSKGDNYPTRPIRMVIPFAPGGASDFVGRIIQHRMSELLGQQVIIDNRSGAAGNIGVEVAATATPDGYTWLLGNIGTMAINPAIYPHFRIRPTRDLIAVTEVVDVPSALVVNPGLPVKSIKELIAYAKANPGKLNFGSPGSGSANRLEMEFFRRKSGLEMVHVPYKGGAGPAITGLLGNEVQLMFVTLSSAINFVKQGRLRLLGVGAPKRMSVLPDTPTMAESGFPQMVTGSWQGVFFPAGTPRAIVSKMFDVTIKTMDTPDVQKRLADGGVGVVVSKSPEEFAKFVKQQNDHWGKIVADAHVVAE